jgi:tRNA threonylcarbamoyladenosine biosynthesis protein TsaE
VTETPAPDRTASGRQVAASVQRTEKLGESLAAMFRAGDVLVLTGPLGAGKTRFVAGLARGLGVPGRVRSPSFTLLNEYRGILPLLHLDLYRLEGADADGLGLEELLERGVLVAEWGEKLPGRLRAEALTLTFEILSESRRAITASSAGERGRQLLSAWCALPAEAA